MKVEIKNEDSEPPPGMDIVAGRVPSLSVFRREIKRHTDWVDTLILLRGSGCRRRCIDLQDI